MQRSTHIPARSTLADALSQSILSLMREWELGPGDRLPSVRDLSERFGVAVPTLREALRRLEAYGIIEVRHGAGIFVRASYPPLMLANPHAPAIDRKVVIDLIDTRILFEPWCAAVAAQNPNSPQVGELSAVLEAAELALEREDDAALQTANMLFHRGIAACSGNVVLAQVMTLLAEIYASEQQIMLVVSNQRRNDHAEHTAILRAIRSGASDEARRQMEIHLQSVRSTIADRLGDVQDAAVNSSAESQTSRQPGDSKEVPSIDT